MDRSCALKLTGRLDGAVVRSVLLAAILLAVAPFGRAAAASSHDQIVAPVLIYHHVKWNKPTDDAIERGLTVHPPAFEAQLRYLQAHHYHPTTALRLVQYLRTGRALPSNPVVLSFDDGYSDVYSVAFPILRRYHMTATLFIAPALLGGPRYLTWKEVEIMAAHGFDIESHTMTHPDLTVVPALQVRGEVTASRAVLQQHLHRPVRVFAYPYGAYNPLVLREVRRAGYWAAFTTHQGTLLSASQMLTLPRVYPGSLDVPVLTMRQASLQSPPSQ